MIIIAYRVRLLVAYELKKEKVTSKQASYKITPEQHV